MIGILARRNLTLRPWRSALLLGGFGLGVGVMIVLLAIGEALLTQARDERLVGGGDVTVLPEGIDVEVMKTGGVGGLFFSISNARFLDLQLLSNARNVPGVSAVAPQVVDKLVYLRTLDGRERAVRATGELPSRSTLVGAVPALAQGRWDDDDRDRRWRSPTPAELRADIDHFHLPPRDAENRDSWSEWHYFNVLSADRKRWVYLGFIVSGAVPDGRWGGQITLALNEEGKPARRFSATFPNDSVSFSTWNADLRIGTGRVTVDSAGRYVVHARARGERGEGDAVVDLIVTPAPGAYLPGASLGGDGFVSGYAVAGLRASARGTICVRESCERYDGVQAYHDHNWGVWRGVTWDWGAARAGSYTFLYGRVRPDSVSGDTPLFMYLVDSLGFRTLLRPRRIEYTDDLTIRVGERALRVPARAVFADARGNDTLRVEITIDDAVATDTRAPAAERGDAFAGRRVLARPYFIQMKGTAKIVGRVGGAPIEGQGSGFFETYR